ncbi:MAG: hypothetical protein FWB88_13020 [Defluviitaleaceae bacterium]|nr:hypothetical protein [Defluviitaleaceae bacterium]MCL2240821.1 hypothetical protein [Defluviitaleaceae bacterium]
MKSHNKFILTALIIVLLAFGGCRYRVSRDEADMPPAEASAPLPYAQTLPGESTDPSGDMPEEITDPGPEEPPAPYIAEANIEATADDFSPITMEIQEEDAHRYATEEAHAPDAYESTVGTEAPDPTEPANLITVEQPSEADGEAVIGTDGGVVGLVSTYAAALRQGINSMFPCQLRYIYCETAEDLVTVARGSALYQLMVDSGGVNVSTRLGADRLAVTADWVVRRNPDAIVKFVDATVLGNGITHTRAASDVALSMRERPGWGAIEAVRTNRLLLLSEQLLESEATRLAAQLLIAYMLYPELFAGIDVNSAVAGLMGEADGIYAYRVGEIT